MTLASVTFQNYFRLYDKLGGMTGTAATEAEEFQEIYGLGVVEVPTNKPIERIDDDDKVFRTNDEKYKAIIDEIQKAHDKGPTGACRHHLDREIRNAQPGADPGQAAA